MALTERVNTNKRNIATNTAALLARGAGRSIYESGQPAAATETLRLFRATNSGVIRAVSVETGTVASATESMTFDVDIAGVSCLTGVITIDDTIAIDTPEAGVIDTTANAFAAGEIIRVVRTYTAGNTNADVKHCL